MNSKAIHIENNKLQYVHIHSTVVLKGIDRPSFAPLAFQEDRHNRPIQIGGQSHNNQKQRLIPDRAVPSSLVSWSFTFSINLPSLVPSRVQVSCRRRRQRPQWRLRLQPRQKQTVRQDDKSSCRCTVETVLTVTWTTLY